MARLAKSTRPAIAQLRDFGVLRPPPRTRSQLSPDRRLPIDPRATPQPPPSPGAPRLNAMIRHSRTSYFASPHPQAIETSARCLASRARLTLTKTSSHSARQSPSPLPQPALLAYHSASRVTHTSATPRSPRTSAHPPGDDILTSACPRPEARRPPHSRDPPRTHHPPNREDESFVEADLTRARRS